MSFCDHIPVNSEGQECRRMMFNQGRTKLKRENGGIIHFSPKEKRT